MPYPHFKSGYEQSGAYVSDISTNRLFLLSFMKTRCNWGELKHLVYQLLPMASDFHETLRKQSIGLYLQNHVPDFTYLFNTAEP